MFYTNIDELRELYDENSTAQILLDYFAKRERSSKQTTVERAEQVTGQDYYALVEVFKKLDEIGVGKFIVGRKGHESRMVWGTDIISIGKVATSEANKFEKVPFEAHLSESLYEDVEIKEHKFFLRDNFEAVLTLPRDFCEADAKKLKAFIDLMLM